MLKKQITELLAGNIQTLHVSDAIWEKLHTNALTRDEDMLRHFCVYFAAFDPIKKSYFLGRHIKSGLWLFNGGHIDRGEDLKTAVSREMREEWGPNCEMPVPAPSLISHTNITNKNVRCLEHYNIWYLIPVDKAKFKPDPDLLATEFYENKWLNVEEAQSVVTDTATRWVLTFLQDQAV